MSSTRIPAPMQFLSLAPATSASYPQSQAHRGSISSTASDEAAPAAPVAVDNTEVEATAVPAVPVAPVVAPALRRRASSPSGGHRILKLGPVYWGEHAGEHKDDFHDIETTAPASPKA